MNCDKVRQHWELYHDSEGDSELYLQINEHLAECPSCAKWFFQQAQFEELVVSKLAPGTPTDELWQRIVRNTSVVTPVVARSWTFFGTFMAVAASLALVAGIWYGTSDHDALHLTALTAAVHQQFAEEQLPIEFVSVSDVEVERYLKDRVPFTVRCPPREDAGFEVEGGGICTIAGEQAAYVVGRVAGQEVSIFILPQERLAQFVHEYDALAQETIYHCREGKLKVVLTNIERNVVVVVGNVTPEQLERVVRAYGTYPESLPENSA